MKTMNLTQQAVAGYEREEKVMNLMAAIRKFLKAAARFFIVISPIYPMYVESLRKQNENL